MKDKGFTLVELLVVFAIVIFLSAIILPNYRGGGEQFALYRSAYRLGQDIRKAGDMAMSAQEFQGAIPKTGYGIVFDTDWDTVKYRLYVDTADDNEFFTSEPGHEDGLRETIELEKGVFIKKIYITPLSRVKTCINFKPPDPLIKIKYDAVSNANEVVITLGLINDASREKTITVNKAGLIEID